ncbi:uncharacterized protein LOC112603963 [Melanaphis sacchari]|uniref:uncharacterized protein LOC112603963 n=1 Tax=Melanaphis sacchari TaxID=742174 RepID=UPI000DC14BA4|nr:uncharacterized protein LOC112603963 [Melanaphis sacchari]
MSKQPCPIVIGPIDANSIYATNNKRKKLSLSKELLREITQFKHNKLITKKENYEINGDNDAAAAALTVFRRLRDDAVARGGDACRSRTDDLLTLWRAVRSVSEFNRTLETTVRALEEQTETLQASLRDAAAACAALDADQSVKKSRSVVLDDFCAVAEQITAQQIRNLEFGRMLAVDERQIGEELHKVEQLKAKISKKKEKKQRLLEQTNSVKSQLEVYKNRYEDLKRKRTLLDENLNAMKRSPSKLANQFEQQGFGQRVKHLELLKNQYNQLTNKREALKLKIQSQQQVVKTPRRINTICDP